MNNKINKWWKYSDSYSLRPYYGTMFNVCAFSFSLRFERQVLPWPFSGCGDWVSEQWSQFSLHSDEMAGSAEPKLVCQCHGPRVSVGKSSAASGHSRPPSRGPTATKADVPFQWKWTLLSTALSSLFIELWATEKFQQTWCVYLKLKEFPKWLCCVLLSLASLLCKGSVSDMAQWWKTNSLTVCIKLLSRKYLIVWQK